MLNTSFLLRVSLFANEPAVLLTKDTDFFKVRCINGYIPHIFLRVSLIDNLFPCESSRDSSYRL